MIHSDYFHRLIGPFICNIHVYHNTLSVQAISKQQRFDLNETLSEASEQGRDEHTIVMVLFFIFTEL